MSEQRQNSAFSGEENRFALVIGVNDAPDAQDPTLRQTLQAIDDAEAIAKEFQQAYCGFKEVKTILGKDANSHHVMREILRFGRDRTEHDFLVLYFAEHGYVMNSDVFLVTSDFYEPEAEQYPAMHLSMSFLRDQLYYHSGAGKILLILDCCNAGNIARTPADLTPGELLDKFKRHIDEYFGSSSGASGNYQPGMLRQALAATTYGRTAGENDSHGYMTSYLLEALHGGVDDVIDLNDGGNVPLALVQNYLKRVMGEQQASSLSGDDAGKACILANHAEKAEEIRRRKRATSNERPNTYIPLKQIDDVLQQRNAEFDMVTKLLFEEILLEQLPKQGKIVGLVGIGGIGKTRLAVEAAYQYKEEKRFPAGIFWLPVSGSDEDAIQQQLAELCANAEYLPSDDNVSNPENERKRARHLCRYLAQHPDALLILDNVDEIAPLLEKILPSFAGEGLRCTILYTSRRPEAPAYISTYQVKKLTEKSALSLLLEHRKRTLTLILASEQSTATQVAREICNYVDRLPLALTLLRDLLQDDALTLEHLWEEQQKRGTIELTNIGVDIRTARLFRTFEQSWEKVALPDAQLLFKLAVYFPEAAPIPLWLLELVSGLTGRSILEPLGKAWRELQRLSLIEVLSSEDAIRLHPLIREFGQYIVQHDSTHPLWLADANRRLLTEFTDIGKLRDRALNKGYWQCLSDIQAAISFAQLLGIEHATLLERVEHWLARESFLLGENGLWPSKIPGLFYQQLTNRALEEGYTLSATPPHDLWLRLLAPVGTEDRALLRVLRHSVEVTWVAFSPDSQSVATICKDHIVRLWDINSGQLLKQFSGHTRAVERAIFSPDGRFIAACSHDNTALIWDVVQGRIVQTLRGHKAGIWRIAFSSNGRWIATASSDCTARVWDVATGDIIACLVHKDSNFDDIAFSSDNRYVVTSFSNGIVFLWDRECEQIIATVSYDEYGVHRAILSSDGKYAAVVTYIDKVQVWHIDQRKMVASFSSTLISFIPSIAFSPDSQYVAANTHGNIVQEWNIFTDRLPTTYEHTGMISSIAFSPDGTKIAASAYDGTVRVWKRDSASIIKTIDENNIVSLQFCQQEALLATLTSTGMLRFWNTEIGNVSKEIRIEGQGHHIVISTDSKRAAIRLLNSVAVWDIEQGRELAAFRMNATVSGFSHGLALSPDGNIVLAATTRMEVKAWDIRTGRSFSVPLLHDALIVKILFSPDNNKIITGSMDGSACIWDAASYTKMATLQGHSGGVTCICVSPDSSRVATGAHDGTVFVWAMDSGKLLASLKQHTQSVTLLTFSPDNRFLLSTDSSAQVFFWQMDQQGNGILAGAYVAPYEICDAHWQDAKHMIMADAGGLENRPHFYRLELMD